jgi:hypothetical protein
MKRDGWFYIVAVLLGVAVWVGVSMVSGRREAWDSELYWLAGMPVLCAGSLVIALFAPVRSWRWGVTPFAGQFVWMILTEGPGNLLPLGIIAFGIFSLPAILAARLGAFVGEKLLAR